MSSLEERYADIVDRFGKLNGDSAIDEVDALDRELEQLDYELRTTVGAGVRYYELTKLSKRAHALALSMRSARSPARAKRTDAFAEAARRARERPGIER